MASWTGRSGEDALIRSFKFPVSPTSPANTVDEAIDKFHAAVSLQEEPDRIATPVIEVNGQAVDHEVNDMDDVAL